MTEFERLEAQYHAQQRLGVIRKVTLVVLQGLHGDKWYMADEDTMTCWPITEEERTEVDRKFMAMEGPPYIRELVYTSGEFALLDYRMLERKDPMPPAFGRLVT